MFTEGLTYTKTITMVTVSCCKCGCIFGIPSDLNDKFREDSGMFFYCPNGHQQHYSESTADKLRKELERQKQSTEYQRQQRDRLEKEVRYERTEKKKAKTRLKTVKDRVANGVCPCCNRHFENLHRHMETKHPEYKKEID